MIKKARHRYINPTCSNIKAEHMHNVTEQSSTTNLVLTFGKDGLVQGSLHHFRPGSDQEMWANMGSMSRLPLLAPQSYFCNVFPGSDFAHKKTRINKRTM